MKHIDHLEALDQAAHEDTRASVAQPRRVHGTGTYTGERSTPMRPGAEDFLKLPSVIAGQLVYRKDAGRA